MDMNNLAGLLIETDRERGILHLTAERVIRIEDEAQLGELCHKVGGVLEELPRDRRYYLMVNISRIVIVPELAKAYSEKVEFLCEHFLCADGLVRYGHQITRLTARLGHEKYLHNDPHLFGTRQEAEDYLLELIKSNAARTVDSAS